MRTVPPVAIGLLGWFLAGSYLLYDSLECGLKGGSLTAHLLETGDVRIILFHAMVLIAPVLSTVFGVLLHRHGKLDLRMAELSDRYRDLYDNAPHGYHSAEADGTIVEANRVWLDMLGYGREEVIGRLRLRDVVSEEGRRKLDEVRTDFKRQGTLENLELEVRRKDGTFLPVLMSSTTLYGDDGTALRSRTILKDISERKRFESLLSTVASEWTRTFDSMPWGVMLVDRERNIIRANRFVSDLAELPVTQVVHRKCSDVLPGSEGPLEDCLRGNDSQVDAREVVLRDRVFSVSCRRVIAGSNGGVFVESLVDITERKKDERKLLDSRNAFFNMLKDASSSFQELEELHTGLIFAFATAIDAKSPWTKGHSERVSNIAVALGKEVGLKPRDLGQLRIASLLHDVGKIGTYDYLLDKPAGLTAEEYEVVKKHPEKSAEILRPISRFSQVIEVVKHHHERYDGSGYPAGLRGEDIPLMARIMCIADSFDSMTADRPYRAAMGVDYAREELVRCAGAHFDPRLVEIFLRLLENPPPW